MKGRISKIWKNKLGDGRTYATLSINGERYTLWDKKYSDTLNEGDVVDYDWKQSGRYKNIMKVSKVETNHGVDPLNNGLTNGFDPMFRKDREIVRMSCIKSAIYLMRDLVDLNLEDRADTVIDMARRFEKYVSDFDELSAFEREFSENPGQTIEKMD